MTGPGDDAPRDPVPRDPAAHDSAPRVPAPREEVGSAETGSTPLTRREAREARATRGQRGRAGAQLERTRRDATVLLWTAGILVAGFLLVGLFVLGTRLPGWLGAVPQASASPSMTPAPPRPTPVPKPTAPAAAGDHRWDELWGGECLQPYASPWAETFTVVDCASPHAAQLVYRGTLGEAGAPFPGQDALAAQAPALCASPGVVDLAAAAPLADVQIEGSYPVTAKQWQHGERRYYCFVSRASGEPITGSLAAPGPTKPDS